MYEEDALNVSFVKQYKNVISSQVNMLNQYNPIKILA
jgi:hypothetical protein